MLEGASERNGKSVYKFTSAIDFPDSLDLDIPFAPPLSRDYKRGLLLEQADYDDGGQLPVWRVVHAYDFVQRTLPALKVGWLVPGDGPTGPGWLNRYAAKGYSNLVGYSRLISKEEYLHTPQSPVVTLAGYEYQEDGHKQLTRETKTSSAGVFVTEYRYASDYPQGTSAAIDELVRQHVGGALVEKAHFRSDGLILAAERIRHGVFDGKVYQTHFDVAAIDGSVTATGSVFTAVADLYEVRGVYSAYDRHGNILEYSQPGGMVSCLLWDAAETQLFAKVDNATREQVSYEGFEDAPGTTTAEAYTGSRSKAVSGVYTLHPAHLPRLPGDYLLSYWRKAGAAPWTRVERELRAYVPGTEISTEVIDGYVDEVRVHPLDAQMVTFAHRPLTGLQASVDGSGDPTYYEYDSLGRLVTVMDRVDDPMRRGRLYSRRRVRYSGNDSIVAA